MPDRNAIPSRAALRRRADRRAICVIHDGMDSRPRRQARAQTDYEGHSGYGPYLCLTCAEALADELPLRWLEEDDE